MRARLGVLAVLLTAGAVRAWQYEDEFTLDQMGARPGGGGNYATGSRQDYRVQCVMCHVRGDAGASIGVTLQFLPALVVTSDGGKAYVPSATYSVDVLLTGEHLGIGGNPNHNMMAATFEDVAGAPVGRLASDTGFSKGGNCPATLGTAQFNAYDAGSTTVTFAGCNSIVSRTRGANGGGKTAWHFQWTAPPDAGRVLMYWGVVDGDSQESSVGDDAKNGVEVLEQGP